LPVGVDTHVGQPDLGEQVPVRLPALAWSVMS